MNIPPLIDGSEHLIFGVEGPAGSGKSTMASTVGNEFGIPVIEGGRFYRQLTYAALQNNLDFNDTERIVQLARETTSRFIGFGDGRVSYDGVDVSEALRDESISTRVSQISKQLEVREIIEAQIRDAVLAHHSAIIVGRWIKKLLPTAYVLNLTIDPDEAERRHESRVTGLAQSVIDRNKTDAETSLKLGVTGSYDATVDVTRISPAEQADILRKFIQSHMN